MSLHTRERGTFLSRLTNLGIFCCHTL